MYQLAQLKPSLSVTDARVSCPVLGCEHDVTRQRVSFRTTPEYYCPEHRIYISPSTFEYGDLRDNLLWFSSEDERLLTAISGVKRESRMTRDNSEDALTWNVFRFLEQSKLLAGWLGHLTNEPVLNPRIMYWSYCQDTGNTWEPLEQARTEFGEAQHRGSEPDIIVETDHELFWIEAKFLSGNETVPSDPRNSKKYLIGGDCWFDRVFKSPFRTIAVEKKLYELTRFWLLGTRAAYLTGKSFYLVNLVREEREKFIKEEFAAHILEQQGRKFRRASWEDIYHFVSGNGARTAAHEKLLAYMEGKSAGYDSLQQLLPGFSIHRVH